MYQPLITFCPHPAIFTQVLCIFAVTFFKSDGFFVIKEIRMKVKFISLASGSSGNCYYIGTEKYGILIDAGIAVRTIKKD